MVILIVVLILLTKATLLYFWIKRVRSVVKNKVDYSFGFQSARDIKQLILKKQYGEALKTLNELSPDEVSLVVDYIALVFKEKQLVKWLEQSQDKNFPHLVLGAHYLFEAWIARTSARASDLTQKQSEKFERLLGEANEHLQNVEENSGLMGQACTKLVRLYSAYGDIEEATKCFEYIISLNKEAVWPYIYYTASAMPKWGGSLELISDLLNKLPNHSLIRQVVELRLLFDSLNDGVNYFGGGDEQLKLRAINSIEKIDKELDSKPPLSVQKYIVYNYMASLAAFLESKELKNKYNKKINGYYTIVPHGVMR